MCDGLTLYSDEMAITSFNVCICANQREDLSQQLCIPAVAAAANV